MAFRKDDIRKALARSSQTAVTSLVRNVLKISDALMRTPPYFDLARRLGPNAAQRKALDTSIVRLTKGGATNGFHASRGRLPDTGERCERRGHPFDPKV